MKYQSFKTTKQKIQKIWEQNRANTSFTKNDLKKQDSLYSSQTFLKKPNIITILDRKDVNSKDVTYHFDLQGFPEWAINMARPLVYLELDSGFRLENSYDSFSAVQESFTNGTLKLNDILFGSWNVETYFVNYGGGFRYVFKPNVLVYFISSLTQFGWSASDSLPVYATLKLYIINEKNYNAIQSG
jgi:hypothetical protein